MGWGPPCSGPWFPYPDNVCVPVLPLSQVFVSFLWWLLREYWGIEKGAYTRVLGIGPSPKALAPAQGPSLYLWGQRGAGRALVPWEATSVCGHAHSLWALSVYVLLLLSLPLPLPTPTPISFSLSHASLCVSVFLAALWFPHLEPSSHFLSAEAPGKA